MSDGQSHLWDAGGAQTTMAWGTHGSRGGGRRRDALLKGLGLTAATAGGGIACAPPAKPNGVTPAQLYVSLARDSVVAVLDTVTDRVVQRISLASLGRQGHASQIVVAPSGAAAVLPVSGVSQDVGLVCPAGAGAAGAPAAPVRRAGMLPLRFGRGRNAGDSRAPRTASPAQMRCERVPVVESNAEEKKPEPLRLIADKVGARLLTKDARGHAYVVVGDAVGRESSSVAVLDLDAGTVLKHLPLGQVGERIVGLAALPDGSRLFAAVYPVGLRGGSSSTGPTRLVAVETKAGRVVADTELPRDAGAVNTLAVGPAPQSDFGAPLGGAVAANALYVGLGSEAPHYPDDDTLVARPAKPLLLAVDPDTMEPLDLWSLDHSPAAVSVRADGRRAYVLLTTALDGPWARELLSLSLVDGSVRRWPVPSGAFALELSPVGKLYIADTLGDRLWRMDTRTDTLLAPLFLPGAPLALGSRPA